MRDLRGTGSRSGTAYRGATQFELGGVYGAEELHELLVDHG